MAKSAVKRENKTVKMANNVRLLRGREATLVHTVVNLWGQYVF
jgi:hypothetical protein